MLWYGLHKILLRCQHFLFSESQKKKSNNQDDSDESDDDEAGPSAQQVTVVQAQAGYAAPMAQPGIPPVAGAPVIPPAGYQGKVFYLFIYFYKLKNLCINYTYETGFAADQLLIPVAVLLFN